MHQETLPLNSQAALDALTRQNTPALQGWTLAGGTGLALQLGHRISEDFDFMRTTGMDKDGVLRTLKTIGAFEVLQESDHTLTVLLNCVKLSFFEIRDPWLFASRPFSFFEIADPRDIALMKIAAIAGRGSRKNFVDLFMIFQNQLISLDECFQLLPKKYGADRINRFHLLKSLVYFDDAEREPLPQMLLPVKWELVRRYFERAAARF